MSVVWLLLAALVLWRWRRVSRGLFLVGSLSLVIASLPVVGKSLVWWLANSAPLMEDTDDGKIYAAIVVPTAGLYEDGSGRWWPTANSNRRAAEGRRLQRQLGLPLIISGGSPSPGQPPEAEVVAKLVGIDNALLEITAKNSAETAAAVAGILCTRYPGPVILVTNATHIARMSASLRHNQLDVVVAPSGSLVAAYGPATWTVRDLIPSNRGFKLTRRALWEYAAILRYLAIGDLDIADLRPRSMAPGPCR